MAGTTHVFDFLEQPAAPLPGVCVVFGSDPFLKQLARERLRERAAHGGEEPLITTFVGSEAAWRDVADELSTVSLFGGGGPRVVLIQEANKFFDRFKDRLEDYAAKPRSGSVLILDMELWQSNYRLYKVINEKGLQVDCRPPEKSSGRNKTVDEERIREWLIAWAAKKHNVVLKPDAARTLLELVGPVIGMLDQDLAKLALFVPEGGKIETKLVEDVVGGWRAKTTWDLNDAAQDGKAAEALTQLDRLLQSGQEPMALFGAISWSLRRFAAATRQVQARELEGKRPDLNEALDKAGFHRFPDRAFEKAMTQLRQIGRARGGLIYQWLLETDLAMKGSHSTPHRARFALEMLFLRLARELATCTTRS